LDFGGFAFKTPEDLERSLVVFIHSIAGQYQLSLSEAPYNYQFRELIEKLHQTTGQQVVVLIDEYDKPITDHLSNPEVMNANKTILHDFYQVLKATDEHLRFIFLTGVSKFSGVSVFSALNNPDDITLSWEYATICGYTQEELETCFPDRIDEVARYQDMSREELLDKIRRWYNGYSWDGKTPVYNPFSTLSFFKNKEFGNYWFRTGTPTFLMELLKKRNQVEPVLEPVKVGMSTFDGYDPADIGEISLLFQTGYLTIKAMERTARSPQYTLGIPNEEVKESFLIYLLNAYSAYPVETLEPLIIEMQQQISAGDVSGLERNLRMLFAYIPYELHVKNEAYYNSLLLLWLKLLGFDVHGQVQTNIGRIDAVWHQPGLTVVAEIKYHADKNIDSLLDEAMTQICDRRYYEMYLDRKVTLMAVAFTGKEVKCRMENIY
jgi:hypothetical protein